MGYRSEVGLVLTKHGVEILQEKLNQPTLDETLRSEVKDLLAHTDRNHVDTESGVEVWHWDWIKWYSGSFDDIDFIETTLAGMSDEDYLFLRIGEEYGDVEIRGNFWNNPFDLGIICEISLRLPCA